MRVLTVLTLAFFGAIQSAGPSEPDEILAQLAKVRLDRNQMYNIRDITIEWACHALWGPKARAVLEKITDEDISNDGFPYLSGRTIDINGANFTMLGKGPPSDGTGGGTVIDGPVSLTE